jgi:hypothetical protein
VFPVSKFAIEVSPDDYENFTIRGDAEYVCQASDTLRRAYAVYSIACVKIEHSPFSLDIEKEEKGLLKTSNDLEAGDKRRDMLRFAEENLRKSLQIVDQLSALTKRTGCTIGQLTLAWG